MPRSKKKSVSIPHPVVDGLSAHMERGLVNYPSSNAFLVGLARYQLIVGSSHPLTEPISRMHPDDQDIIDDYLLHMAETADFSNKGILLDRIVTRIVGDHESPSSEVVNRLLPHELLKMAKEWKETSCDLG